MLQYILFAFLSGVTHPDAIQKTGGDDNISIHWITLDEAIKNADIDAKLIFIDFYADWCSWCKKLDQTTYSDSTFIKYINKKFYAVKFNAEQKEDFVFKGTTYKYIPQGSRGTNEFALQFASKNGRIGYPTITILDKDGKKITVEPGYKNAEGMLTLLKYYGEGYYQKMDFNTYLIEQKNTISAD